MTSRGILKDENGLILPRKIVNPCVQSVPAKNIQREIKWNNKKGINVLNNKSELQKALEKQRKNSNQKLKETENESCTQFDKILAERAQRLLKFEAEENHPPDSEKSLKTRTKYIQNSDQSQTTCKNKLTAVSSDNKIRSVNKSGESVDKLKEESVTAEQESEFARVFAQLRGEKRWD
eukprot:TRINITY_DN4089_c0_g1_i8.p1 TRINITY_DN4089_c0_g1~~TRINITY_DN4089_c0_g1_i8.p1  ORF type:complete len:178 (+),score=57.56 TRINITY_DN4089_c0_g1_i8:47-580(+)